MKEIKYVLGSQWGDEGKGKTVQYLCQEAINQGKKPLVIRYCSGPQASHTVMHGGITHVCSSFGSGVLLGVPTYIMKSQTNTLIDPIALKVEYEVLQQKGITPIYDFSILCDIITPYDIIANRQNQDSITNGTCGCGIWETINRINKLGSGKCNFDIDFRYEEPIEILEKIRKFYDIEKQEELEEEFINALDFLFKHRTNINMDDYDVHIMESSQGLLLDGVYGLKPYTTPCCIGLNRIIHENKHMIIFDSWVFESCYCEIYLCTRTYTTRHGAGYIPKESDYIRYPRFEANKDNQYQGQFKTGILDIDMINRAVDRHCLDNIENCKFNLVINHVDCIGSMFEYIYQGRIHVVPGFDAVTRIQNLINLKFDKVLIGKSPLSEFEIK